MLIFSVATDGSSPFSNMIWEEAVVNALYRGERPTFPSHIPFQAILEPLVNEDNGYATRCWADNPRDRPQLTFLEVISHKLLSLLLFFIHSKFSFNTKISLN